jgi:hypothetical protein
MCFDLYFLLLGVVISIKVYNAGSLLSVKLGEYSVPSIFVGDTFQDLLRIAKIQE